MSAAPQAAENTFLAQAKLREQPLGRIAWADDGGSPRTLDVRNVGYLHRLRIIVNASGQYATAGPTSADQMGVYSGPIGRIVVRSASVAELFNVSGFMLAIISAITICYDEGYATINPAPGTFTASPGTSAFANKWAFEIPISLYLANHEAPLGLFQTAIQGQETQVEIRHTKIAAPSTNIVGNSVYIGNDTNAGSLAGYTDIEQVYFEPISQRYPNALPNQNLVHQWADTLYPVSADGDIELRLPAANVYLRLIIQIVMGATPATLALSASTLTRLRLTYGANITPYDWTVDQLRLLMAKRYGNVVLPPGVFIVDLIDETHTERDALNSAASTELRAVLSLAGGAYAGGAYVRIAREQLIPYAAPGSGSVGVQGTH